MKKTIHTTSESEAYSGRVPRNPLRFTWFTAKPSLYLGILALFGVILAQTAGSLQPFLVSTFVDTLLSTDVFDEQLAVVYKWSLLFMVLFFVIYVGWRTAGYAGAVFVVRQNARAAKLLYEHTVHHSHSYFTDNFAGSISNKIAHASDGSSEMLISMLFDVMRHTMSIIVSGILLVLVSPYLTLGFFVVVILTTFLNYFLVLVRRPMVVRYSEATTTLRGQIIDTLSNIQAVRQYSHFTHEDERIAGFIKERAFRDLRQWHFSQHINVINNVLALSLTAAVLIATYHLLEAGQATPGNVILVMMASFTASYSMLSIGEILNRLMRYYGEASEGLTGLLVDHEIADAKGAKRLKATQGRIEWEHVHFQFGENRVFNDFNLTIEPGQRVGLVGPSGAGKTTFVSLLLRQHDIPQGSIRIDGADIAAVTQSSLRENIAIVPQEPILFHRTLRENIAYGNPYATQKEIEEVAKKAQAHDFIIDLPEQYETLVGERGVKLSGGQKQRIAIARAMLKDAPILVLDEATSALDSESEVAIQKALHRLMEGKTVVAIAHRLSTLREMDRIIVLENGQVVEDGNHESLVRAGGTYARLWEHQAGGFLQE